MEQNSPTKPSLARQVGVSMVLAALICAGFYYFWYSDALEWENLKRERLELQRRRILALERTATYLPEFQREVRFLEAKLKILRRTREPVKETAATRVR